MGIRVLTQPILVHGRHRTNYSIDINTSGGSVEHEKSECVWCREACPGRINGDC